MVVSNSTMTRKSPFLVRQNPASVEALRDATPAAIQRWYIEFFENEVSGGNTKLARRRIAWRIQADSEGGLPESAMQHALGIARNIVGTQIPRQRPGAGATVTSTLPSNHDSRLPVPGAVLVKEYKGVRYLVRVLPSGFEWEGDVFRSLSALAKHITGTKWNGYTFFGLERSRAK